jgi:CBS domain-containing protein
MKVSELMNTNPITVTPNTAFSKVWELIFEKRISGIPVVDSKNLLLGIISEEDLIEKLYPSYEEFFFDPQLSRDFEAMEENIKKVSHLKAKYFMNKNVYTTSKDAPIMKAASSMLIYKVSCLPVIEKKDSNKIVVGIICKGDIFSELFKTRLAKAIKD